MWPRATSRTWTMLSPVSTEPTILPLRKSTTICPVGVGLTSHGPIGAAGLTMTIGAPRALARSTERLRVEGVPRGDRARAALERRAVASLARQHAHAPAVGEALPDEVGADDPGAARDERFHRRRSPPAASTNPVTLW